MKVLVTGGAGFIGSHTIDTLVSKGYDVRVFDIIEPQVHGNKKPDYLNENVEFIFGDVRDKKQWKDVLDGVDAIIHLAAMVGVGQSMYQPVRYLTTNTIGTANLFEVLIENPEIRKHIQKIIVASSKSIYGEGAYKCDAHGNVYPNPRETNQLKNKDWDVHCPYCSEYVKSIGNTEEKPVQNLSIYALSKYDTERISLDFGMTFDIPVTAFRYFNVYGPRQSLNNPYTGVTAIFLSRIKNNNPPVIFEDGAQTRDFIYVEDIVNANLLALEKADGVDVFNVGSGEPISILEIAKVLIELSDSKVDVDLTQQFRAGDNRHDFSDISKIKKELGFKPKRSIKDGFQKLVNWAQTQEAVDRFKETEEERVRYLGRQ